MTNDATGASQPEGESGPFPVPAPEPAPAPASGPTPLQPGSRFTRLRRRFAAMGTANKIAALGLVIAALPVAAPLVSAGYDALFGEEAISMDIEQADGPCATPYLVPAAQEAIRTHVPVAQPRTVTRWEAEKRITHLSTLSAIVSIRGNSNKAVQLRDLSITVTRRAKPLSGTPAPPSQCGGRGPEGFLVDLDSLPVGRPIPASYLSTSPQQRAARAAAKDEGWAELRLPKTVTTSWVNDFELAGRTRRYYTEWRATLTWWDGETLHRTNVDNDGRPFRVTADPRTASAAR